MLIYIQILNDIHPSSQSSSHSDPVEWLAGLSLWSGQIGGHLGWQWLLLVYQDGLQSLVPSTEQQWTVHTVGYNWSKMINLAKHFGSRYQVLVLLLGDTNDLFHHRTISTSLVARWIVFIQDMSYPGSDSDGCLWRSDGCRRSSSPRHQRTTTHRSARRWSMASHSLLIYVIESS